MPGLYPEIEPHERGMLEVGDGNLVYWEVCGNPRGKSAVVRHGGPGSGCTPGWRRYFDPAAYRIALFDQRGRGRSAPHGGDPTLDLAIIMTGHLILDIERLREQLGIERWLVLGGSWGSTLGIAYAERFPERVSEMVLFGVVTTSRREGRWVTRDADLVAAYYRLLHDPSPAARERAARDWCAWEDSHVAVRSDHRPSPRYVDPTFRMAFARLVTHSWHHAAWLEDGAPLRDAGRLAGIPGVLVNGRIDLSSPLDVAWHLSRVWPGSELVIVDEAGHGTRDPGIAEALIAATDRFAARSSPWR